MRSRGPGLLAAALALAATACATMSSGPEQPTPMPSGQTAPAIVQSTPMPSVPTPTPMLSGLTPKPIPSPTPTIPPERVPAATSPSVPTATEPAGPPVNRIAFVGTDNHVYTVAADGTGLRQITPMPAAAGGPVPAYTWPTWSPDARSILLSAAVPDANFPGGRLVVYVADANSPERGLLAIHQDRRGSGGILPGVFHYAIWSPDGEQVAIIAVALNDLAVFLSKLDGTPARPLIAGAPMYVTWSWDSERVFVHQQDRLMVFDLLDGSIRSFGASARYQAPVAATNRGGRLAYVVDGADGTSDVVVSEADGANPMDIAAVPKLAAIQWSPDGRRLAIGRTVGDDSRSYGEFLIADLETGEIETVLETPIFAFEWSPDGERILIAEDDPDNAGVLRWSVMSVAEGTVKHIVDIRPTAEFGLALVYFDQYAQSHRLWSPDGSQFVLAGVLPRDAPPASDEPVERVWIIDAAGEDPPLPVAEGYLAFWSPR